MKDDMISRQAAIKTAHFPVMDDASYEVVRVDDILALPSAQPGQRNARVFQGIIVEYPSISAYPEYEGKPYFSIKYTENGQEFIGYGTYKPEVLSEFLKEYFMLPTQPGWIPTSERLPEEDTEVLISYRYKEGEGDTDHVNIDITSYGTTCFGGREIHTLKEWRQPFDYFHANYEVIAWMPLPTPYREGGQDGKN